MLDDGRSSEITPSIIIASWEVLCLIRIRPFTLRIKKPMHVYL